MQILGSHLFVKGINDSFGMPGLQVEHRSVHFVTHIYITQSFSHDENCFDPHLENRSTNSTSMQGL